MAHEGVVSKLSAFGSSSSTRSSTTAALFRSIKTRTAPPPTSPFRFGAKTNSADGASVSVAAAGTVSTAGTASTHIASANVAHFASRLGVLEVAPIAGARRTGRVDPTSSATFAAAAARSRGDWRTGDGWGGKGESLASSIAFLAAAAAALRGEDRVGEGAGRTAWPILILCTAAGVLFDDDFTIDFRPDLSLETDPKAACVEGLLESDFGFSSLETDPKPPLEPADFWTDVEPPFWTDSCSLVSIF